MPKVLHRIIYDDDGNPMKEGSKVLVNGKYEEIIHFDDQGEIAVTGWELYPEEIETVEQIPDDRFGEIEDSIISEEE